MNDATTGRALGLGLGGAVLDDGALDDLLRTAVDLACHAVVDAHSVSITVADNGSFRTPYSTDDEALRIDEAQYAGDDGPCLRALRSASQVQVAVSDDGGRWPQFAEKAVEVGVTAVLSTPLIRNPGEAIGALNVYGRHEGAFGGADVRTATLFGEHVAILVDTAHALVSATQLNEQLRHAVASREIIGEAKGIIMERESCTRDEAFEVLRRASQRENRKLRDLAEDLVLRAETREREGRFRP